MGSFIMQLAQETRHAILGIRRSWRFALAFIVPLALGIGAGATFYSIIDHILHRPPPHVADPQSIVRIAKTSTRFPDPFSANDLSVAWPDYDALVRHTTTLASVAAFNSFRPSLGRGENARTIPATLATPSYFTVLGVKPMLGRFYLPEEDAATARSVPCVASERFWRTELASSRTLGQRLDVGSVECTIVGVAPRGFNGTGIAPNDLWLPLRASAEFSHGDATLWSTDRSHWLRLLARTKPGVPIGAINQDAARAYRTWTARSRDSSMTQAMVADPLMGNTAIASTQGIRLARWLVGGAFTLVLLVCANVVNLLVARNISRIRETAIRLALGSSRGRLFRHYLLECLALSLLAGIGSLLIVGLIGPIVRAGLFPTLEWADGPVTIRIVAIAMGISLLIGGIVAAITAVYASSIDPATLLAAGGGTRGSGTRRTHRLRMALVGTQAAISVALLLASAGFVRSFRTAANSALGFDIDGMIIAVVPNLRAIDSSEAGQHQFFDELHARLKSVPGVIGVSQGFMAPWLSNRATFVRVPGRDSLPLVPSFGVPAFDAVTPDYLQTMRMSMVSGRWISDGDHASAPPVLVVTEALAQLYWPQENAIGQCMQIGQLPACREIVGVVRDIRFTGKLDDPLVPAYFLPVAQASGYNAPRRLFIRVDGETDTMIPVIRRIVQGARSGLPAADVRAMQDQFDPLLSSWRLGAIAFTALGIVAAIVAILGLFSVIAYLVAERGREFAIRSALGARAGQILKPILRQGLSIVAAGAGVGVIAAWRAEQWLQPLLFQVQLLEAWVVAAVVGVLLIAGSIAAFGPARRASIVDPIDALRSD